ncbi:hypothetical protein BDZ91DRAFT_760492 [Kalaharituber pfeilii]|nr:hypothetical protein BDZ91DRAFT_760492 [Kalaharituber pfeilii]
MDPMNLGGSLGNCTRRGGSRALPVYFALPAEAVLVLVLEYVLTCYLPGSEGRAQAEAEAEASLVVRKATGSSSSKRRWVHPRDREHIPDIAHTAYPNAAFEPQEREDAPLATDTLLGRRPSRHAGHGPLHSHVQAFACGRAQACGAVWAEWSAFCSVTQAGSVR